MNETIQFEIKVVYEHMCMLYKEQYVFALRKGENVDEKYNKYGMKDNRHYIFISKSFNILNVVSSGLPKIDFCMVAAIRKFLQAPS